MEVITHKFGKAEFVVERGSRLDKLCAELKEEFPKLQMNHKRKVWFHWIAHVFILIFTVGLNRRYINGFTTTGKNRIDWSDHRWSQLMGGKAHGHDVVWVTLRHERMHLRQFRDKGALWMTLIWAFPPILFCYGRAVVIEKPGYLESLRATWTLNREWAEGSNYKDSWISKFTGPDYGWAWILRSQVERWFDDELKRLREVGDTEWS